MSHPSISHLRQHTSIGVWSNYRDPYAVAAAVRGGFDWVCIDEQHGGATPDATAEILAAIADESVLPLVRVAWNRPELIGRALDSGASGVIVPMVNTADEAAAAARASRFPPEGIRSWGPRHSVNRGVGPVPAQANERALCLVMVETAEALDNVESIAATPGVDGIFVGPFDLSLALGLTIDELVDDATPESPLARILDACHANACIPGVFGGTLERGQALAARGFQMLSIASDSGVLSDAAVETVSRARALLS